MFKKNEMEPPKHEEPPTVRRPQPQPTEREQRVAWIGPSIKVQGTVSGAEDMVIEGHLEGEIRLEKNHVTIGRNGRLHADVYAKSIRIEGELKGNLFGSDDVVIRESGRVEGNLKAPRVTLENGCVFRGSIDMEVSAQEDPKSSTTKAATKRSEPAAGEAKAESKDAKSERPAGREEPAVANAAHA